MNRVDRAKIPCDYFLHVFCTDPYKAIVKSTRTFRRTHGVGEGRIFFFYISQDSQLNRYFFSFISKL